MKSDSTKRKPTLFSPQQKLVGELPGLLSLWKYDREGGKMWRKTGGDIIAAWAGLQRLVPPGRQSEWLPRLEEILRADAAIFLEVALASRFEHESWRREVEQIDTDWDRDLSRDEAEELEWRAQQAFEALDQVELLAWFAEKQAPGDARVRAWLGQLWHECQAAEAFIADRPDRFLCLASDLADVLACSRPGLETDDPQLWETLGKHRRIEEVRDEVELSESRRVILGGVSRAAGGLPGYMKTTSSCARESMFKEGGSEMFMLNDVLRLLEQYGQRATYGAVAGVVGGIARSVMQGLPRTPRNSWVVALRDGRPTGYSTAQMHGNLFNRSRVIADPDKLLQWLRNPS